MSILEDNYLDWKRLKFIDETSEIKSFHKWLGGWQILLEKKDGGRFSIEAPTFREVVDKTMETIHTIRMTRTAEVSGDIYG